MTSQLPRFWCFFAADSWEKDTKNWAAVTSLRFFLFRDDFSGCWLVIPMPEITTLEITTHIK